MASPRRIHVHAVIDNLGCGGAEMLLAEFAEQASEVGVDLSVANLNADYGDEAGERLRTHGIEPRTVPVSRMVDPRDFRRLRRHVARISPDLVHTHLGTSDWLGTLVARSLALPAVSTLHSAEWRADDRRERLRNRLSAAARKRFSARTIAVSEAAKQAYLATGWARPESMAIVHNGVAGRATAGAGRGLRSELGIPVDSPVVVMLSTLRPEKRHELALAALPALRERFPDVRLLVAGDGDIRAGIEAAARPHGEAVRMLGHRDDVMAILDAADVLLHPSSIEAFPTALLEAMAASVPVVATSVGGIPEIVSDGETGVLLEPDPTPARLAEEVGRLLAAPGLRASMGSAARRRFERAFTLERWASETRALYEEVLAEHSAPVDARPPAGATARA